MVVKIEKQQKIEDRKKRTPLKNMAEVEAVLNAKRPFSQDELEIGKIPEEVETTNEMFSISSKIVDPFGNIVELITKSRIKDYAEAHKFALMLTDKVYYNMEQLRYGGHSVLVEKEKLDTGEIDGYWYQGCPVSIMKKQGKEYYKVGMYYSEIYAKIYFLLTIPTQNGMARLEHIHSKAVTVISPEMAAAGHPVPPLFSNQNYKNKNRELRKAGDMLFEEK